MNIAVAGTGYVGLSLAVLLAQSNKVTAVDIVEEKVNKVNNRISPIQDAEIEEYLYVYLEFAGTVFHKERGDADLVEKNFKREFARKWYSLTHKVGRKIKK